MIGLDSLSGVDLSFRLKQRLGIDLPLEDLLAGVTGEQACRRLVLLLAVQQVAAATAPRTPDDMDVGSEVWVL
jgi:acyl carrier protein